MPSPITPSHWRVVRGRLSDATAGALRRGGFSVEQTYNAILVVDSYLYGFTLQEVNWPFQLDELPQVVATLAPQIPADTYPYLGELMAHIMGRTTPPGTSRAKAHAAEFTFGLDLILDGLDKAKARG